MATCFTLGLGDVVLEVDDIWPDGYAPENPTPEDVVEQMAKCGGGAAIVAKEWNLLNEIEVVGPTGERAVYR